MDTSPEDRSDIPKVKDGNRHEGIQLLRFLSVLWVGLFHYFYYRSYLFPFKDSFRNVFFATGWLGVRIFFIISGFVIAISLTSSHSIKSFAIKRAKRLYPSLWLILPLVFLVQRLTPGSPFLSLSSIGNLLVSMLLIPPNAINMTLNLQLDWVTLVLWSLKVEILFYVAFAVLYFSRARKYSFWILLALSTLSSMMLLFMFLNPGNSFARFSVSAIHLVGWDHLSWFCLGIFLSEISREGNSFSKQKNSGIVLILFVSIMSLMLQQSAHTLQFVLIVITTVISTSIILLGRIIPKPLKLLAFLGDSSYEMYLLHQGIGLTISLYLVNTFKLDARGSSFICLTILASCFALSHVFFNISKKLMRNANSKG